MRLPFSAATVHWIRPGQRIAHGEHSMGWKCKGGCKRTIETNTAYVHKCAYDQRYGWDYHYIDNNTLRAGFLGCCCQCALDKGWSGFDAHGCRHCKVRVQEWSQTTSSQASFDSLSEVSTEPGTSSISRPQTAEASWINALDAAAFPHPQPGQFTLEHIEIRRPWLAFTPGYASPRNE